MDYRRVTRRCAIIVAVLLTLSVFVSGPLHQPYELRTPHYAIAHESTDAYDDVLNETGLEAADPVEISTLSPETQRAFFELKAQPVESGYGGHDGWQHTDITVCNERMVVCDEYAERPDFHTTRSSYYPVADRPAIRLSVITYEGERYVASDVLRSTWDLSPLANGLTVVLLAAYGLFIVGFAYSRGKTNPVLSLAFTGFGVPLVVWPYLMMYLGIGTHPIWFIVAGVVIGISCWITLGVVDWRYERS